MLLTITTTHQPATDLGFLLAKHPDKVQSFDLNFGQAHVFFPEATDERCTAALLLDVDPIGLVRRKNDSAPLAPYVNDRPYVASSFLSVAIAQVLRSALSGSCKMRPGLSDTPLPLEVRLSSLPCRGGERLLRSLFEPLGYEVEVAGAALDARFPEWGDSPYLDVTLRAQRPLREILTHIYVLVPVLDNEKHYWVGDDELEKLLRHGEGWLKDHPARDLIARRYLKYRNSLAREALSRLFDDEDVAEVAESENERAAEEERIEKRVSLYEQRVGAVLAALKTANARSVVDLGCGDGRLLQLLAKEPAFRRLLGIDVSTQALEHADRRLRNDRRADGESERVKLAHGSLVYRDRRLSEFDAAIAVEVIEHLEPNRRAAFERVLFEFAHPRLVVITTPNVEYNVHFRNLPTGTLRHRDHRFEWNRAEFEAWCRSIESRFGYTAKILPIGEVHPVTGPPTQMAVFEKTRKERVEE